MLHKLFTSVLISLVLCTTLLCSASAGEQKKAAEEPKAAYLFVYFMGNAPGKEQVCYALSTDGCNFTPLNDGRPVMAADTIALTGCVRDPHILRAEDGRTFLMVLTDMKSSLGWDSNRGIVLLKSTDLIHWEHHTVHFPTRFPSAWRNVTRVWAPETIYDPQAGRYMVYFSLRTTAADSYDKIYYSYANADFTDLETAPVYLFDNGRATIDGDIVFNPADNLYHLFYKSEAGKGIYQAVAPTLTGGKWQMTGGNVEQTEESVEGVGVCRTTDGKEWIVMYDCYMNGHYQFCRSTDLRTFRYVQNTKTGGAFTPRHGTLLPITRAEADRLRAAF